MTRERLFPGLFSICVNHVNEFIDIISVSYSNNEFIKFIFDHSFYQ